MHVFEEFTGVRDEHLRAASADQSPSSVCQGAGSQEEKPAFNVVPYCH